MNRTRTRENTAWGVGLLLAAAVPFLLPNSQGATFVLLLLAVINTIGLSLLIGFARQLSIGQAAFYAIGAYAAAILATNGVPTLIAFIAAPLVSAAVAWVIGRPLLTLSGPFLAFATLALHLIVLSIITMGGTLTGGSQGLRGIPLLNLFGFELRSYRVYGLLGILMIAVIVFGMRNLIDSRPGRALRGLAGPESSVVAVGVDAARVRLTVFVLSAALGGAAGGLYTFTFGFVAPSAFPVMLNFQLIIMATLGGLGTILGAVVGATLLTLLIQWLNVISTAPGMPPVAPTVISYSFYAIVLIATVILLPRGLVPLLQSGIAQLRRRKQDPETPAVPPDEQISTPHSPIITKGTP